jgi:Peptidase A4 family
MNWRKIIIPGAAALALAFAGTAAGASTTTSTSTPHPSLQLFGDFRVVNVQLPRTHLQHVKPVNGVAVSNNWSGYVSTAKSGYQTQFIVGDWNVPSVNCANSTLGTSGFAYASTWVGLDGWTDSTVEQDGIDGWCDSTGTPQYASWYEMYPLAPVAIGGVNPGDAIQAAIKYLGGGVWDLALVDVTQNAGFSVHQSCPSGSRCFNSSAEVVTEDPGGAVPAYDLADYGMANYDGIRVAFGAHSGSMGNSTYWNAATEILMEDPSGHVMSQPSALFGGQAFSTSWKTGG